MAVANRDQVVAERTPGREAPSLRMARGVLQSENLRDGHAFMPRRSHPFGGAGLAMAPAVERAPGC